MIESLYRKSPNNGISTLKIRPNHIQDVIRVDNPRRGAGDAISATYGPKAALDLSGAAFVAAAGTVHNLGTRARI